MFKVNNEDTRTTPMAEAQNITKLLFRNEEL